MYLFGIQRKNNNLGHKRKVKQLNGKLLVISLDKNCQYSNAVCFSDCSLKTYVFSSSGSLNLNFSVHKQ